VRDHRATPARGGVAKIARRDEKIRERERRDSGATRKRERDLKIAFFPNNASPLQGVLADGAGVPQAGTG
jgi:hypothetical protein